MSVHRDRRRQHEYISCEEAAADAIKTAGQSVRNLRVAEVATQGIHFGTAAISYRTKIQLSFKYEQEIVGRAPADVARSIASALPDHLVR